MPENTWIEELDLGHYKTAVEKMLPLQDSNDQYLLQSLGSLFLYCMHPFDGMDDYKRFFEESPASVVREFWESNREYVLLGVRLLERASELGSWVASHNLGDYYLGNVDGLSEDQLANKRRHYFGLVDQQRRQMQTTPSVQYSNASTDGMIVV